MPGPLVSIRREPDLVTDQLGVVCRADGGESVLEDAGLARSRGEVVDRIGHQWGGFPGSRTDDLGQLGDLAVQVSLGVVGKDEFVVDYD
jgi:hypothetical protein